MSKFPYLKLKKYGSSDETDLTDKEVQAVLLFKNDDANLSIFDLTKQPSGYY